MNPTLSVDFVLKDGSGDSFTLPKSPHKLNWISEPDIRWAEVHDLLSGNNLHVYLIHHDGFDATEVIVNISNGVANNGVCYFRSLTIIVDDQKVTYNGEHVIRPRGMFAHRFVVGPDAEAIREYKHLYKRRQPTWAPAKAKKDINKYLSREKDSFGPYKPFWNNFHSLSDSHGGAGIAPYSNWLGSSEGYKLRALEFYGEVCRTPIACFSKEGIPKRLDEKYWLGRTPKDELPQYNFPNDYTGWCPYEDWLLKYEAHDYTHLWRTIRAASELAPRNPFARRFLQWVWHDCKLWLQGNVGDQTNNSLFWSLDKLIKTTEPNQTAWWAGRGYYHVIRCFLATRAYLPRREVNYYNNLFSESLLYVANDYGVCFGKTSGWNQGVWNYFGNVQVSRGFETQLLATVYAPLGLSTLLNKYQNTFPEEVPNWFEANDPSNGYKEEMYRPYRALYKMRISGYPDAAALIKASESRGINGASQDLDCHQPRSYYSDL